MKRALSIIILMAILSVPALVQARKTTYIVTNKRLNYVKLVEVKPAVAEERNMSHPVEISETKMREILTNLKLNREHLIGDDIDTKDIFNDKAINYLAPALSRAFREAQANEEVQFSYVVKNPKFILRNDRLTMVTAWVSGDEMYLDFEKLYAKLTGDTDKRGGESKIVNRSRGLRVSLELGPGQQMAAVGSNVLVVDLQHSYTPVATSKDDKTSTKTVATSPTAVSSMPEDDVTQRLERLDTLHKRGLISNKEYKEKKAEILKDL